MESFANKTGIIGLGYVGLPLVLDFCDAGYQVTGFDIDQGKVNLINKGSSYINYIPSKHLKDCIEKGSLNATTDFYRLADMDQIIITVPTPLNDHREPDLSFIINTAEVISQYLRQGQLIVLESTTYPGTTKEVLLPILEKKGLIVGEHFYLAYSPERVDPNNKNFSARKIPKVVGGVTENCLEQVKRVYGRVFEALVPVSSVEAAEASKLLENIFRSVNIALVNELKMLFDRMNIDVWEVIEASSTKPFGFMPFYPGPGLGGHCIPIDPFYLTWKAREFDFSTRFIELAGEINSNMPYYVVQKVINELNQSGKSIRNAKVLVLGASYKKDIDDIRESPAVKVIKLLEDKGALVSYHDPYIPTIKGLRDYPLLEKESLELNKKTLSSQDCVVILTDHSCFDYPKIVEYSPLIIDTRNALRNYDNAKITRA